MNGGVHEGEGDGEEATGEVHAVVEGEGIQTRLGEGGKEGGREGVSGAQANMESIVKARPRHTHAAAENVSCQHDRV